MSKLNSFEWVRHDNLETLPKLRYWQISLDGFRKGEICNNNSLNVIVAEKLSAFRILRVRVKASVMEISKRPKISSC